MFVNCKTAASRSIRTTSCFDAVRVIQRKRWLSCERETREFWLQRARRIKGGVVDFQRRALRLRLPFTRRKIFSQENTAESCECDPELTCCLNVFKLTIVANHCEPIGCEPNETQSVNDRLQIGRRSAGFMRQRREAISRPGRLPATTASRKPRSESERRQGIGCAETNGKI